MVCVIEEARGPCVEAGLVSPLLKLLKDDHRVQCQIQAARALGNICYENGQCYSAGCGFLWVSLSLKLVFFDAVES